MTPHVGLIITYPRSFLYGQKFIVNEAFWKRPGGPVFLYISGEGPLSKFSVLAGICFVHN